MSRDVFDKVKDSSSSMAVLLDTASNSSGKSQPTDNMSKMSKVFQFDTELISSAVYQRAVRSMTRNPRNVPSRDCKFLLLGARGSGKELLMKQIKISQQNHNRMTELLCYKYTILSAVVDIMRRTLLALRQSGLGTLVDQSWWCEGRTELICRQELPIDRMTVELAAAMDHAWEGIMPLLPRIETMWGSRKVDHREL